MSSARITESTQLTNPRISDVVNLNAVAQNHRLSLLKNQIQFDHSTPCLLNYLGSSGDIATEVKDQFISHVDELIAELARSTTMGRPRTSYKDIQIRTNQLVNVYTAYMKLKVSLDAYHNLLQDPIKNDGTQAQQYNKRSAAADTVFQHTHTLNETLLTAPQSAAQQLIDTIFLTAGAMTCCILTVSISTLTLLSFFTSIVGALADDKEKHDKAESDAANDQRLLNGLLVAGVISCVAGVVLYNTLKMSTNRCVTTNGSYTNCLEKVGLFANDFPKLDKMSELAIQYSKNTANLCKPARVAVLNDDSKNKSEIGAEQNPDEQRRLLP